MAIRDDFTDDFLIEYLANEFVQKKTKTLLDKIIEQEGAADVAQYIHDKYNLFDIMDSLEPEMIQMLKDKAGEPGHNTSRIY